MLQSFFNINEVKSFYEVSLKIFKLKGLVELLKHYLAQKLDFSLALKIGIPV